MEARRESAKFGGEYPCRITGAESDAVLIGRLRFWKTGERIYCRERCVLCLRTLRGAFEAISYIDTSGNVVAVVCALTLPEGLARKLAALGVPYLLLPDGELPEESADGRLALIDVPRSRLTVDPSIEVIDEYTKRQKRVIDTIGRDVSRIADREMFRAFLAGKELTGGWLCDAETISREGDFFDLSLTLSERLCAERLCISLAVPNGRMEESFSERAEALFCAAVFGELSVMLRGYASPLSLEKAIRLMHKSFCKLESEGREVSGYLVKGILIDSPMQLLLWQDMPRTDFVCFDFDLLCERLLGCCADEVEGSPEHLDVLCKFWENFKKSYACRGKIELRAKSDRLFSGKLFLDWAEFMGVGEIYVPNKLHEQKNA